MRDISKLIPYVLLVLIFGFLLRGTFIMLYPYKPITIHQMCAIDNIDVVVAGDKIYYSVRFTKHTQTIAVVHRRLVNSYVLPLPNTYESNPVGEHIIKEEVSIPEFADPGIYVLKIDYEYIVSQHPGRKVVVSAESPKFKVVKRLPKFAEINAKNLDVLKKQVTKEIAVLKQKIYKEEDILKNHRIKSWYDRTQ